MLAKTLPEWMISAFGVPYPTSEWVRNLPPYLEVDFVRGSLCGVALGDDIERLSFLGRADSANEAAMGILGFSPLGLALVTHDGKLHSVTMLLTGSPGSKHKPFEGIFHVNGNRHMVPAITTEAEAIALFGEPTVRGDQRDGETGEIWETSLRYVNGSVACEVVFDPEGQLVEINLEPSGEGAGDGE